MDKENHLENLIKLYSSAPINQLHFKGSELRFNEDNAEIRLPVTEDFFHGMGTLHGSVAFKLLDDAAFFAAQAQEQLQFLVTSSFQIHFLRPGKTGELLAVGTVRQKTRTHWISEVRLFDERSKEIAFGSGTFQKSELKLADSHLFGPFQ
jgi:uncharacterized protein (TIGR00369 family)